jgi:RNA recognition motif-containing protein
MAKKIYVGNLNYRTTAEGLRGLFTQYGEVVSANVVTDRQTGQARGFGFVEMAGDEEAKNAIAALDGQDFEGRKLRVNEAMDRPREPRDRQY